MESIAGDRAVITFAVSDSKYVTIAADHGDERLAIYPDTDTECNFSVGYDESGAEKKFDNIYLAASNYFQVITKESGKNSFMYLDPLNVATNTVAYMNANYTTSDYGELWMEGGSIYSDNFARLSAGFGSRYVRIGAEFKSATETKINITAHEVDFNQAFLTAAKGVAATDTDYVTSMRTIRLEIEQTTDVDLTCTDKGNAHSSLHTTVSQNFVSPENDTYYIFQDSGQDIYIRPDCLGDTAVSIISARTRGNHGSSTGLDVYCDTTASGIRLRFYNSSGSPQNIANFTGTVYVSITYLGRPT